MGMIVGSFVSFFAAYVANPGRSKLINRALNSTIISKNGNEIPITVRVTEVFAFYIYSIVLRSVIFHCFIELSILFSSIHVESAVTIGYGSWNSFYYHSGVSIIFFRKLSSVLS